MFRGFGFIWSYIYGLLIITKGDWSNNMVKLELTLKIIKYNGLKCNIEKSFFGKTDMEFLGFWVTRNGIQPISKKLEAIVNMMPPKNQRQLCTYIVLVNY